MASGARQSTVAAKHVYRGIAVDCSTSLATVTKRCDIAAYHLVPRPIMPLQVFAGDPLWPDGRPDYKDVPAAGGVCGYRNQSLLKARFGRFCKRAFGLPVWGATEPGRALITSWSPEGGWAVQLGAEWSVISFDGRGGLDFQLETKSREFRGEFQQVLRAGWLGTARGDAAVNPGWPRPSGQGGLWNALALYAKKYVTWHIRQHAVFAQRSPDGVTPGPMVVS